MIGQTLRHYKILSELGRGGMGVVYKALDTKLNRTVALKFLPPDLTRDQEAIDRFINEAQAASSLDHANICTIYEINETAEGQLYIAMAGYDGQTLEKKIAGADSRPSLRIEDAIDIAMQIARGLERAHEAGIIHRDIKPSNVIITTRGEVKIIDFGLAKLAGQRHFTKTGNLSGTVAYMSPEQVQGQAIDHRTDIWSLGVVLYEMLTGALPFQGEGDQALIFSIVNEEARVIASLRKETPALLVQLVHKAMQKNPAARHQTMAEVIRDLARLLDQATASSEKNIPAIVVLPFADLSPQKDQEYFCDGITEELVNALSKIEGWRVVSRTSSFAFKGKEQDIRAIGKKLNVSHALEGSVRKAGNRLRLSAQLTSVEDGFQLWSGKYDREMGDVFAIQDDIAGAIVDKLKMKLAGDQQAQLIKRYTENLAAYNLYLQARFYLNKRTEPGLRKSITFCEQAIALEPGYALAYAGLADSYILLCFQGFLPPQEAMPKAKAAVEQALAIDETLAEAHTSLGCIRAIYEHDWAGSEKEFLRALALNPNHSMTHYWYALWYLLLTGQCEAALAETQKALEFDPLSLVINTGRGWQFYLAGQHERALLALEQTLEMDKDYVFARDLLGQIYAQQGRYEEAIDELEKAVALSNRRTLSLAALGHVYAVAGKTDEAKQILEELLALAQQKYVSSYDVALIYAGLSENERAMEWLEKAYEEHNCWLGFLNIEPRFHRLRQEARFVALLEKVGLQK